jgi:hypothetical protein
MTLHVLRLPFSLDPLIAEAKRRARQRRALLAAMLVLLAGGTAGAVISLRSLSPGPSRFVSGAGSPGSHAVPKSRLIVPAVSIGNIRFREPRREVAQTLGPGRRIGRYHRAYLHGRLRIDYSYHDGYTGRAQALITKWSGYRTRSGIHVGSTRHALDGLHVRCFSGMCTSGQNPDYPGTLFMMRHSRVVEIYVGAS